ncbi:MAG: M20/M25/M40 family metallo-hydrolase [Clostridia bacterium]|nr:M20/M25/M40 family metallo-hydrolase [Clostridia bacterium]
MINESRLLAQFLEYVQISSPSRSEGAMAQRAAAELAAMGLAVQTDRAGETFGSDGFNVLARLPGEGESILLAAHLDTVSPGQGIEPVIEVGVITSRGETVLGGDDKSGVCAILEAVRALQESGAAHRPAEILFTVGEECGLCGAKALDAGQLQSRTGFIFDASGSVGRVVTAAPGQLKLRAVVHGRSAHAGNAPEAGVSAIQVMAKAIAAMNLLRIDAETTCNIGSIHADFATNIVPDRTEIVAEVRSRDAEKMYAQAEHMRTCLQRACDEGGARLEYAQEVSYLSYSHEETAKPVRMAVGALERIGCAPVLQAGGGGSDANILNQKGLSCVVLGTGMTDVHTTKESITVRNLCDSTRLAYALLTGE